MLGLLLVISAAGLESRPATVPAATLPDREAVAVSKHIFLPNVPRDERPVEVPTSEPSAPPLRLTGLMFDGKEYVALLEGKAPRRSALLAVGDDLGPWHVERIELSELVLKNSEGSSQSVTLGADLPATARLAEPVAPGGPGASTSGPAGTPGTGEVGSRSIEELMRERRRREQTRP